VRKEVFISRIGAWLIRALGLTLRIRVIDDAGFASLPRERPFIAAFWHNRMLVMPLVFERHYDGGRKGVVVLTSASRDGTLLAEFMKRFGIGAVRGSSSRRGATAVRELSDLLAEGKDVVITPDGPRGPCYTLGPGIVFLAQTTGQPVLPVHAEYSRCLRVKSWDRFMIPLPFSTVNVRLGALHFVKPSATDAEFEAERARLEEAMQPIER
jgi:lysophospholipid acyltransferase (LPLAT)-like uncharacterized protein